MDGKEKTPAFKTADLYGCWSKLEGVLVDYVYDFDHELNFDGRARGADEMSQTQQAGKPTHNVTRNIQKQMKADGFNIRYT